MSTRSRLVRMRPALLLRSKVCQAIREFFLSREFLEVETPLRMAAPAQEPFIEAEPSGSWYLRTSPEFHMKRLLCAGYERVFQIGACFRQGERGARHNPEFTMLEWYRAGADYLEILAETRELLTFVAGRTHGASCFPYAGQNIELQSAWDCRAVRDVFQTCAGWDPLLDFDEDRFDLDLVGKVEPALPMDRPVVLRDYPVERAAFARCTASRPPFAERWELYIGGMELANAFSELTDPAEQRARLEHAAEMRRMRGQPVYPQDEEFLHAMEQGMPESGGAALGLDRLVMLLADAGTIDEVRLFCSLSC